MALRVPPWLVVLVFLPLQIWFFLEIKDHWGWWWTIVLFLALAFAGSRAARAPFLAALLFPARAIRHERRRHVWQGALFLAAALAWLAPQAATSALPVWVAALPQPWLPLAFLVTLVKSALR